MSTAHLATTADRKVHFEFEIGHLVGLPSCNSGGPVIDRLADLDDEGGQEQLLASLQAAGIAPSRLCGRCFAMRTRVAYRNLVADNRRTS